MSALLNRAIQGYKTLIDNKGFTTTKESDRALNEFVSANDNVMRWISEAEITEEYLLRQAINDKGNGLYHEYKSFCWDAGEEPKEQKDFSRAICQRFEFETCTRRINGARPQMFRKKK